MKGGLGNLMKQAQKMQEDMQKAQEELKNLEDVNKFRQDSWQWDALHAGMYLYIFV